MKISILDTDQPLTLIGGGVLSPGDIETALSIAPTCVAADGGADTALAAGVTLAAVIGDMDSISDGVKSQIDPDHLHEISEQDSTDFDKALRSLSTPLVVAVGFTGARIDHELSALHTLLVRCDQHVVLLGSEDVIFLCPPRLQLSVPPDTRVSLFPMGAVQGTSTGLYWPVNGLPFEPGVLSGTSNKSTGDVDLTMDGPRMLCVLPRRFIRQVVSALLDLPPDARWPAP